MSVTLTPNERAVLTELVLREKRKVKINPDTWNDIYLDKMLNNQAYLQIYFGGSSSGKSYSKAECVIIDVVNKGCNYLVVRNTARTLRDSCFNEVTKAIIRLGKEKDFRINKTDMHITHISSRKQILFAGLDDVEKLKSITPIDGVLDRIWIEEATETDYNSFKQLTKRLRGQSKNGFSITFTFNPVLKTSWIYEQFFKGRFKDDDKFVEYDDISILKTTYKDNKFLDAGTIQRLEDESDKYYYQVYTLGNWGVLAGIIFKNWRIEDFSDIEPTFDNYKNGVDWGFANDPFAFIRSHYDVTRKRLYICDEICQVGLLNEESSEQVKAIIGDELVTCDSAEPKSIQDFCKYKLRAIGAKKGPGSIEFGIKWLQSLDIVIHPRNQNTINNFSSYKYKEDKDGNVLPVPVDKHNDCIDALRYSCENVFWEQVIVEPEPELIPADTRKVGSLRARREFVKPTEPIDEYV